MKVQVHLKRKNGERRRTRGWSSDSTWIRTRWSSRVIRDLDEISLKFSVRLHDEEESFHKWNVVLDPQFRLLLLQELWNQDEGMVDSSWELKLEESDSVQIAAVNFLFGKSAHPHRHWKPQSNLFKIINYIYNCINYHWFSNTYFHLLCIGKNNNHQTIDQYFVLISCNYRKKFMQNILTKLLDKKILCWLGRHCSKWTAQLL